MKPSIFRLQKIFKLEAERGHDNRAVMGGLDRMLEMWESEARADSIQEELIQAVITRLRDYPRLSPASRAESLDGLWKRIQRETGDAESKSTSSARKPQPTPPPPRRSEPGFPSPIPKASGKLANESDQELANSIDEPVTPPVSQSYEADQSGDHEAEEDEYFQPVEELPAVQPARQPVPAYTGEPAALSAPVTVLQGVGPRLGNTLGRLGIHTLGDMLYYFPRRYDDYSKLTPINRLHYGEEVTVIGTIKSVSNRPLRSGKMQLVEAIVSDETAALRVYWFNQAWIAKRLRNGMPISLSGKVDQYLGRMVLNNPEWEPLDQQQLNTNRIVPVYSLTSNITQRWLRKMMNQVVGYWAPRVHDPLPPNLRRDANLVDLPTALYQVHFPVSMEDLKAARKRLAFDEIFLLQLGVLGQKHSWQGRLARSYQVDDEWMNQQLSRLPFPLTGAQQRTLADIRADLASSHPMNRLLQGDVGSGKTVIAALAAGIILQAGAQVALMAPTSILAEQHYQSLKKMLAEEIVAAPISGPISAPDDSADEAGDIQPAELLESQPPSEPVIPPAAPLMLPDQIRLLIGATPEAEKRAIRNGLEDGSIHLVIGTHALIEEPVVFQDLQLAIVDEQHRFGVQQRAALRSKGDALHLLVMTATPIPRSLALTVYGDLDLSVIDEMPPGRQPVATYVISPRERERAYQLIRKQVQDGRQAFIIYPLVEESETSEAKAAVDDHSRLQSEVFPELKLGLLHGRMRPEEKDQVMLSFRNGETNILVSTSVVEVGVDVPNATVMLIEGANRFGLAQLHQFRGRVGRGSEKSYCLLIPDTADSVENQRLQVMAETNDGFVLAERDLEQRGPGEFLGTRQSGYGGLRLASLTDILLIDTARRHAQALFALDPGLSLPQHQALSAVLVDFWTERSPQPIPTPALGGRTDIS